VGQSVLSPMRLKSACFDSRNLALLLALVAGARASDVLVAASSAAPPVEQHEQWGLVEIRLSGPASGNPFIDVQFTATFQQGDTKHYVSGFYEGDGRYCVRFMPEQAGQWQYTTASNAAALHGKVGRFDVSPPSKNNHGPVRVRNTFHFSYADGTPFRPL